MVINSFVKGQNSMCPGINCAYNTDKVLFLCELASPSQDQGLGGKRMAGITLQGRLPAKRDAGLAENQLPGNPDGIPDLLLALEAIQDQLCRQLSHFKTGGANCCNGWLG